MIAVSALVVLELSHNRTRGLRAPSWYKLTGICLPSNGRVAPHDHNDNSNLGKALRSPQ